MKCFLRLRKYDIYLLILIYTNRRPSRPRSSTPSAAQGSALPRPSRRNAGPTLPQSTTWSPWPRRAVARFFFLKERSCCALRVHVSVHVRARLKRENSSHARTHTTREFITHTHTQTIACTPRLHKVTSSSAKKQFKKKIRHAGICCLPLCASSSPFPSWRRCAPARACRQPVYICMCVCACICVCVCVCVCMCVCVVCVCVCVCGMCVCVCERIVEAEDKVVAAMEGGVERWKNTRVLRGVLAE